MIEQITTAETSTTTQELIERAKALRPLLKKNAAATEDGRRVSEENIQAIADSGLFRITVPRRYGGYEVNIRTKLEVSAALAEGCGSTAWAVTLINVCNWFTSLYSQKAQDEVFGANPNARVAGVFAPSAKTRRVDGGMIVTGKWYYSSGSLHATWGLVGVPVVNEAGVQVDQGLALIPMEQLSIEDTWYVTGMKGTGSNALVANEVFVPDYRILSLPRAIEGDYPTEHKHEEALYRAAFVPVAVLVLVGPQLGMGRAALEYVIEKAPQRAIAYTSFQKQTDSVAFQLQIAEAATKIDTATCSPTVRQPILMRRQPRMSIPIIRDVPASEPIAVLRYATSRMPSTSCFLLMVLGALHCPARYSACGETRIQQRVTR